MTRDRAICLRRLDYSETSQILSIFTRAHGVLRVIAKGAKRATKAGHGKFDGGLDLLDVGEAVFIHSPEKEMSALTEWTLVDGHLKLRESLRGMYLAQFAAELVGMLLEEQDAHQDVFDDLEALLPRLGGERLEEALLVFELRFLHAAGLLPEFGRCVFCGGEIATSGWGYFSPSGGGAACEDCEASGVAVDRMAVDARLLRLCAGLCGTILPKNYGAERLAFGDLRPPRLTRGQTDPINRMLIEHIKHATHREPKLGSYVLMAAAGKLGTRVGEVGGLDSQATHGKGTATSDGEQADASATSGVTRGDGGGVGGGVESGVGTGGRTPADGPANSRDAAGGANADPGE